MEPNIGYVVRIREFESPQVLGVKCGIECPILRMFLLEVPLCFGDNATG